MNPQLGFGTLRPAKNPTAMKHWPSEPVTFLGRCWGGAWEQLGGWVIIITYNMAVPSEALRILGFFGRMMVIV